MSKIETKTKIPKKFWGALIGAILAAVVAVIENFF